MDKLELLAAIRSERAALDALVASIDDAALTAPHVGHGALAPTLDDGHSVKDLLAHISLWEGICARWLQAVARGETPDRPEVIDVDATNARAHAAAQGTPLAGVLDESRRAHQSLLDAVGALSDADLADEARFGWPTWRMVSGNSDEHYREHIDQITAWRRGISG
jgi:hypothetical protein